MERSLLQQPWALPTFSSLLSITLCQCSRYKLFCFRNSEISHPQAQRLLRAGVEPLEMHRIVPFSQVCKHSSPEVLLDTAKGRSSYKPFSLFRAIDFLSVPTSELSRLVIRSWLWHCTKMSVCSVFTWAVSGSRDSRGPSQGAPLLLSSFSPFTPVQEEPRLGLNQ